MTRDEYLKMLRDNETFQQVMKLSSSDAERRAIKAYTEDFMMKFYRDVFEPVEKATKNDPEALKNAYLEFEKELIKSGSTVSR
jgi:hypothetical protein